MRSCIHKRAFSTFFTFLPHTWKTANSVFFSKTRVCFLGDLLEKPKNAKKEKKRRLAISLSLSLPSFLSFSLPLSLLLSFFLCHHAVHYIPRTCSSYNWMFLLLWPILPISPTSHSPLPTMTTHPTSGNHQSVFYEFSIFLKDSTYKGCHWVFVFLCLISLIIMSSRSNHVVASGRISFLFMAK